MKSKLLALFILGLSVHALAQSGVVPTATVEELRKFRSQEQALSEDYVRQLPLKIHQEILTQEKRFQDKIQGQCQEMFNIKFGGAIIAGDDASREFEDGMIRVEASKCFTNTSPEELLRVSESKEFKAKAFSTIRAITQEGPKFCETTYVSGLGNSHYCYLTRGLENSGDYASTYNFVISNGNPQTFNAQVFFREGFVSARQMGSVTQYHIISYVRGAEKMSSFKQFFAKGIMQKEQENVFETLRQAVQK